MRSPDSLVDTFPTRFGAAPSVSGPFGGVRPLLIVALAGVALVGIGVGVTVTGLAQTAGLVKLGVGATLCILAGVIGLLEMARNRRRDGVVEAMMRMAVHDPDPLLLTDESGSIRHASRDVGAATIADLLQAWLVDPGEAVRHLIDGAHRAGFARRRMQRQDATLELTAMTLAHLPDILVWRVVQRPNLRRVVSPVGVPVVQFRGTEVTMNAQAHDELGKAPELLGQIGALDVTTASAARMVDLRAADGQVRPALVAPQPDGGISVWLLPPGPASAGAPSVNDLEIVPVPALRLDRAGRIVDANTLAQAMLGLDDQPGRPLWDVVDDLGRSISDWILDGFAGRSLGRPEIVRLAHGEGDVFVQIVLQRGPSDDYLIAVLADATELKTLEARFIQSQKMQAIGQLAGGIAHDFNNLLTAISGHCDLLMLERDRYDPAYNDLVQIYQNTNRAAALVRQLLAFSRKQTLRKEKVPLEQLLEDMAHLLTRLVGEKIEVRLRHDPAITVVEADPRQMEQVIMNLVVNARDAMPMGGIIRIETQALRLAEPRRIGRATLAAGSYVVLRVVDSGVGIPEALQEKIFEPFFTTKKTGEGTGLGLSTVYGIVKQMGGYVFVDSVEGAGTTFTLYFSAEFEVDSLTPDNMPLDLTANRPAPELELAPVSAPLPGPVPAPDPEPATQPALAPSIQNKVAAPPAPVVRQGPATPLRKAPPHRDAPREPTGASGEGGDTCILLAEDEAPVRAFAARALRLQGFRVLEASDGEQALALLVDRSVKVDLFITDVVMPVLDGPAWVRQATIDRPGTPVIFMSGYAEDAVKEALARVPQSSFLGKPFSLRELIGAVQQKVGPAAAAAE